MAKSQKVLSTKSSAELLSYIINVTPELRGEIDLPVQGQSIKPIGQIIINNENIGGYSDLISKYQKGEIIF